MRTLVLALLVASVAAVPIPDNKKTVKTGKAAEPIYIPAAYSAIDPYSYPVYNLPQQQAFIDPFPVKQLGTAIRIPNTSQDVKLMLTVPAKVPPGTSVTVTVNVANNNPGAGTVLSVSNPVVTTPTLSAALNNEAVIVDAKPGSGPSIIDSVQLPDDYDNREPPLIVNLPFDNPKDSPLLVALQEEAIKQQMMAALVNRQIA